MKTISGNTKRGKAFIRDYELARESNLNEIYDRPSVFKVIAWNDCLNCMKSENGRNMRIMSFNTFHFTCGWMTDNGLRVETASNSYLIELSNEQFLYL